MYRVNVLGTVATTQRFLPLIRKAKGRIVNVASIAGRIGLPTQPAYCASKYAVEGLSEVLRQDMLPWGVSVHIVEPGVYSTTGLYDTYEADAQRLWDELDPALRSDYGEPYFQQFKLGLVKGLQSLGKLNGPPTEVCDAMVHALTSDQPMYRYRVGK
jgi:retinol dehydrogenase-16